MPAWVLDLVKMAIAKILEDVSTGLQAKELLAEGLLAVDAFLKASVAAQSGPLGAVEQEVVAAFDKAVQAIVAALRA